MSGIIGTSHSKSKVIGRSKDTAKAWVSFDGTTNSGGNCTINDDFNLSSVTDESTGRYNINFATNMANANYCFVGTARYNNAVWPFALLSPTSNDTKTTSTFRVGCGLSGQNWLDCPEVCVAVFGD